MPARADRRADQRGHQLGARDRALRPRRSPSRSGTAPIATTNASELQKAERHHHQLRAPPPRRSTSSTKLELDYAILDEAQNIKNPISATAQSAARAQRRTAPGPDRHADREPPARRSGRSSSSSAPGLLGPLEQVRRALRAPDRCRATRRPRSACARSSTPSSCAAPRSEVAKDLPPKIEVDKIVDLVRRPEGDLPAGRCARSARRSWARSSASASPRASSTSSPASRSLRQAACDPRLLGLPARVQRRGHAASSWPSASSSTRPSRGRPQGARLQPVRDRC